MSKKFCNIKDFRKCRKEIFFVHCMSPRPLLLILKAHAVPMMRQTGRLALPVLKKCHSWKWNGLRTFLPFLNECYNMTNTLNETYPKTTWTQHKKQSLDGQRGMQSECSSKSKDSYEYLEDWTQFVTWYRGQVLQFVHWGHIVMLKLEYMRWLSQE